MKTLFRILVALFALIGAAVAVSYALQESQKNQYITLDCDQD